MKIIAAAANHKAGAIQTVVMAFGTDPVVRWLYPRAVEYLAAFPRLVDLFAGGAFDQGTAFCTEDFSGASLWLPPNVEIDGDGLMACLESTVAGPKFETIGRVFAAMGACHPKIPHWYLPLMGVDPARQGEGLGSRLLVHALAIADGDGLPAYLEATSEGSRDLYARHGFTVIEVIREGAAPPVFPMIRKAVSATNKP